MITTTTDKIEGREVSAYLGPVGAEVIWGTNAWKDAEANLKDLIGGRVKDYERVLSSARATATAEMQQAAATLQADAIVGLRYSYQTYGEANRVLMVAVNGTAVRLAPTAEQIQQQQRAAEQDALKWIAQVGEKEIGPLSINQLRDLVQRGRIAPGLTVRSEDGAEQQIVENLIK